MLSFLHYLFPYFYEMMYNLFKQEALKGGELLCLRR